MAREVRGIDYWTEEQVEIAGDLGFDEIERRVEELSSFYKFDSVASIYDSRALTPDQAIQWAKFAQSLGKEYLINGSLIQKLKTLDEQALIVVQHEITKRKKDAETS